MSRSAIDLRKRPEPGLVELILMRSESLLPADRALLDAYYARGVGAEDLARINGSAPRTIRRRVRTLSERVLDDAFVYVMRGIDRFAGTRRQVAKEVFLHGRSRREAARIIGLSLHTVRRHCNAIEELALAERSPSRRDGKAA